MTSPLLSTLIWEEVLKQHEGMGPGEYFRKKPASLCLNMAYQMMHNNFVIGKDKAFNNDDSFLEAF
jgi:hypothetical protein